MRRSICYAEPQNAEAGESNTWTFIYTPAQNLPKGTKIKFDMGSNGRDIDWETPSVNLKQKSNVIYGIVGKNKAVPAKAIDVKNSVVPHFEFILPQEVPAGDPFTIYIGSPKPV